MGSDLEPQGRLSEEDYLRREVGLLNANRINWFAIVLGLVHIAAILLFLPYVPGASEPSDRWRNGVILTHSFALTYAGFILLAQRSLAARPHLFDRFQGYLIEFTSLVDLFLGVALSIIDQQVNASTIALLVASMGAAATLLVRPVVAVVNYAVAYLVFFVGVTLTQPSPDLLLTMRVNSLAAVGLGFGLSLLQWRNHLRTIHQQRRIEEQQRELELKNRELTKLASHDLMTGLLNRTHFLQEMKDEIARSRRTRRPSCLIMLDVDHFKQTNDTYGHPAGDRVLIGVAQVLRQHLREVDLVARFGGEEFAILLPESDLAGGLLVAERLRTAIAEQPFGTIRITVSLGVAEVAPTHKDAIDASYRAADRALYQAKQDGRNCVRSGTLHSELGRAPQQ